MACTAWHELLSAWIVASRRYATAVIASRGASGSDFQSAVRHAEEAKVECVRAEQALREHEQIHGCLHGAIGAKHSA